MTRTGYLVDDTTPTPTGQFGTLAQPPLQTATETSCTPSSAVTDWHFQHVSFHEMYDLDKDPYQLNNIYQAASPQLLANLSAALDAQYVNKIGGTGNWLVCRLSILFSVVLLALRTDNNYLFAP